MTKTQRLNKKEKKAILSAAAAINGKSKWDGMSEEERKELIDKMVAARQARRAQKRVR